MQFEENLARGSSSSCVCDACVHSNAASAHHKTTYLHVYLSVNFHRRTLAYVVIIIIVYHYNDQVYILLLPNKVFP